MEVDQDELGMFHQYSLVGELDKKYMSMCLVSMRNQVLCMVANGNAQGFDTFTLMPKVSIP